MRVHGEGECDGGGEGRGEGVRGGGFKITFWKLGQLALIAKHKTFKYLKFIKLCEANF